MKEWNRFIAQVAKDTGKGIKGYIKAQLTLMSITFLILFMGFTIIEVPHPFLISAGISILDIIPVLGIGMIMVPWSIISFIMGNTQMGTEVAILFAVAVVLRQILEPILVGSKIGVGPVYTFAATLLGSIILGPIGIVLGPVLVIFIHAIKKRL